MAANQDGGGNIRKHNGGMRANKRTREDKEESLAPPPPKRKKIGEAGARAFGNKYQRNAAAKQRNANSNKRDVEAAEQMDIGTAPTANHSNESKEFKVVDTAEAKRERRKEQKERSILRKKKRSKYFDLVTEAKQLWERIRIDNRHFAGDKHKLSSFEREQLIAKLMKKIQGKMVELIFKHDASRIIQTCLKYGSTEQKAAIYTEIKGSFIALSKSVYGRFLAIKMLRRGTKEQRTACIEELYGHVRKLLRNKISSEVVEEAYSEAANALQRTHLIEELYAHELTLQPFRATRPRKLSDFLADASPEKRKNTLKYLAEGLTAIIDKGIYGHSIIHTALLEYLDNETDAAGVIKMIGIVKEALVAMLHTKPGCRATIRVYSLASAKDRKAILGMFKDKIAAIAREEFGHLALLRVLEVTDDTVMVAKRVLSELLRSGLELCRNKFGCIPFLFLLAPQPTPRYVKSWARAILDSGKPTDAQAASAAEADTPFVISKKPADVRRRELLGHLAPELLKIISENIEKLLRDPHGWQVVVEALSHLEAGLEDTAASLANTKRDICEQIVRLAQKPLEYDIDADETAEAAGDSGDTGEGPAKRRKKRRKILNPLSDEANDPAKRRKKNILLDPVGHKAVRQLIKGCSGTVPSEWTFAGLLAQGVRGRLAELVLHENFGAFVAVSLLEAETVSEAVAMELRPHLDDIAELQTTRPGCKVIIKKLAPERLVGSETHEDSTEAAPQDEEPRQEQE